MFEPYRKETMEGEHQLPEGISEHGGDIRTSTLDSVQILKKQLHGKDRKLKVLKKETRKLINELDYAYKKLRKTQEELILRERMSAAGGVAMGIAYEIKNSLSIIGMSVQHLHQKFLPGDERREFTEAILQKVKRLNTLASDLMQFARPREPCFQKCDINQIIDRVLSLVKIKSEVQRVSLVKKYTPEAPPVMIDKDLIEETLLNLIDNAFWAMPKGGELRISTEYSEQSNSIEIQIQDTGFGISRSDCSKIFDPFFTRKENGIGMGLSIVHRIIEEHRGAISVESELKKGTTFRIKLPVSNKKQRKHE